MNELKWAQSVSSKIKQKMKEVAQRNQDKIPYTTKNGIFDNQAETNICWWTNGFWGGMMWQLYNATSDEFYKRIAEKNEKMLDKNLMQYQGLDHDNGFKWLPTSVANYRVTGNAESKNRAIISANDLAGRFNIAGNFIRAWNDDCDGSKAGWAIIDCMMNLPLLYWASKELNDLRFTHIAKAHADMAQKFFVREDGSVNHIVEFDHKTGDFVKVHVGQGYDNNSSWTRGQTWAIYGFALSYIHTGERRYLNTAKQVANYFIANTPDSNLIPVDFRQPEDCILEDSTAAAIAACGMLEIAKLVEPSEAHVYKNKAVNLLKALDAKRCNWDSKIDNILEKCTAAFHDNEHEFSIIYGDYYFIEAIFKLTGEELFIW